MTELGMMPFLYSQTSRAGSYKNWGDLGERRLPYPATAASHSGFYSMLECESLQRVIKGSLARFFSDLF